MAGAALSGDGCSRDARGSRSDPRAAASWAWWLMRIDQRLTKAADFAAVWRRGRRRSDALLVLIARRNGLSVARFGFSVGKRVGKAVVRNLVKRRIREAARAAPIRAGWDVVISARSGAASKPITTGSIAPLRPSCGGRACWTTPPRTAPRSQTAIDAATRARSRTPLPVEPLPVAGGVLPSHSLLLQLHARGHLAARPAGGRLAQPQTPGPMQAIGYERI